MQTIAYIEGIYVSPRFTYVKYDEKAAAKQEHFKKLFEEIEEFADKNLGNSREKALLMTALEEAYMWTGKAIRNEVFERQGKISHEPERG